MQVEAKAALGGPQEGLIGVAGQATGEFCCFTIILPYCLSTFPPRLRSSLDNHFGRHLNILYFYVYIHFVYICIYVYMCVYTHTYTYIYTSIHLYILLHSCMLQSLHHLVKLQICIHRGCVMCADNSMP